MYVLRRVQTVRCPPEEAFAFFSDPANLARITPPWLSFRHLQEGPIQMREGVRLHYRIRPLGLPQRWVSVITEWDPPRGFVDEQVRGPYRFWRHVHRLRPVEAGTEIEDRVEYALPLGLLGRLAHAILVRRQLDSIFAYRERRVRDLLGTPG